MRILLIEDSDNIISLRYDAEAERLWVKFKNQSVYRYDDMPGDVVGKVAFSKSVGGAFNNLIRDKFPARKVK